MSKAVNLYNRMSPSSTCIRSRLFLRENNFFVKIRIWISSSAAFRLYSATTFAHWLVVMGFNRRWEEGNLSQFLLQSESKNAHFSFGRGNNDPEFPSCLRHLSELQTLDPDPKLVPGLILILEQSRKPRKPSLWKTGERGNSRKPF